MGGTLSPHCPKVEARSTCPKVHFKDPCWALFSSPDFVPALGHFADVLEDTNTLMGPICSSKASTAECLWGCPACGLGTRLAFSMVKQLASPELPGTRRGGNPEVNSSRRDVRTQLSVGARRGRQVSQQGQVPATPGLAARQGPSAGPGASHA